MGVGKIFYRGGSCGIFLRVGKNIIPKGAKSGEISFYTLETKKSTFFAKDVIGKCQISKSRGLGPPSPLPTHMNMGHYLWGVERAKRFVNVHLHCIVSSLKKISKLSMLPPPLEKFLRTSMAVNHKNNRNATGNSKW